MSTLTQSSYGSFLTITIDRDALQLLADHDFDYTIEDILERDDHVAELAAAADFARLRNSTNGRLLLAAWKARAMYRDEHYDPRDDVPGFAPLPIEDRDRQLVASRDDEAFRYSVEGDHVTEDDFAAWEQQDCFVRDEVAKARQELLSELKAQGVDPKSAPVQTWLRKRYDKKGDRYGQGHGPQRQLATLRSCLVILRSGYRTGFQYSGLRA